MTTLIAPHPAPAAPPTPSTTTWSRRAVRALVAITLAALVLRTGWLAVAQPAAVSDALGYKSLALRYVEEGRYERGGEPTAWRAPGYVLFLGAGILVSDADGWLGLLNVVAATSIVPLTALLAWRVGLSVRVSLTAAALAAVMPPLVLWSPVLGSENVQVPLLLAGLAAAAHPERRRSSALWSGVLLGAAVLVRPESLFYLPVVPLLLLPAPWRRVLGRSALVSVVAVAVCVPWVVRNTQQVGPVGLSSTGGVNFFLAHGTDGYGFVPYDRTPLAGLDEVEMSRHGYRLAVDHLRDDPSRLWADVVEGTAALYSPPRYAPYFSTRDHAPEPPYPRGVRDGTMEFVSRVNVVGWTAVAGLAVVGVVVLAVRRERALVPLLGTVLMNWVCFAVVFWALQRYRFAVEPVLCIVAAAALTAAWELPRRGGDDAQSNRRRPSSRSIAGSDSFSTQ